VRSRRLQAPAAVEDLIEQLVVDAVDDHLATPAGSAAPSARRMRMAAISRTVKGSAARGLDLSGLNDRDRLRQGDA